MAKEKLNSLRQLIKNFKDNYPLTWLLISLTTFFIGLLAQPMLAPQLTEAYASFNLPGFEEPEVSASVSYQSFRPTNKFQDINWSDSYGYYQLAIVNKGNQPVQEVNVDISFPGCIVDHNVARSRSDITLRSDNVAGTTLGGVESQVSRCSGDTIVETLSPQQIAIVDFVVEHNTSQLQTFVDLKPSKKIHGTYFWNRGSALIQEEISGKMYSATEDKYLDGVFYRFHSSRALKEMEKSNLRAADNSLTKALENKKTAEAHLERGRTRGKLYTKSNNLSYLFDAIKDFETRKSKGDSQIQNESTRLLYTSYRLLANSPKMKALGLSQKYNQTAKKYLTN